MENEESKQQLDWSNIEIGSNLISLLPIESLERYRIVPFEENENEIKFAAIDPEGMNVQNALRFFAQKNPAKKIKIYPIKEDDFGLLMDKFNSSSVEIEKALDDFEKKEEDDETNEKSSFSKKKETLGILKDAPVAKMVEVIIKNAIDGKASDIHIEPLDEVLRVRYRIDGILHNSISLPKKIGPAIISRVKILSNLKIDEKRKPQDGRFRIEDLGRKIDFRVSSLPTSNGEKIVMRILDTKSGLIRLEELGIRGRDLEIMKRVIEEPHGIILVTGPTGSGKSTTLYSALKILNREGVNIITLEDPVEYVLEGVNQSQVHPEIDYTFASGLRSILRQDPDIIMVGEIRDEETAELAIHAALTGHLVLSTLHTNSAIGAVARLLDMGIQPFLLASSLKLLFGQRLVRKICPDCRVEVEDISADLQLTIRGELEKMPPSALDDLAKRGLFVEDSEGTRFKLFKGEGCKKCGGKGMKGRVGIYEVIEVNDRIGRMISDKANENDIEKEARKDDYTTMKQDGIIKVLAGETTMEEVQRVSEEDSEEETIDAKGE